MTFKPAQQTTIERDDLRLTTLGLMTAGIVHDVGNMIQVLSSAVRIFERHPSIGAAPTLRPVIADASAAIEGATDLIRQLSGFARGTEEAIQDVDIAQCFVGLERLLRWIMALDPFFTTKAGLRGSGLGLAMVRRFAERAGGSVALQSTIGKDTEVTLQLSTFPR